MKMVQAVLTHLVLGFLVIALGVVVGILLGKLVPQKRGLAIPPARVVVARASAAMVDERPVEEAVLAQPHVAAVTGRVHPTFQEGAA